MDDNNPNLRQIRFPTEVRTWLRSARPRPFFECSDCEVDESGDYDPAQALHYNEHHWKPLPQSGPFRKRRLCDKCAERHAVSRAGDAMLDIWPEMFGMGEVTHVTIERDEDGTYIADFWHGSQLIYGDGDSAQQAVDDCVLAYQEWLAIVARHATTYHPQRC